MRKRFATAFMLVMLVASPAAASHMNPLMAPTAPWAPHIREMNEALASKNVRAAERAWHDAYVAALGSRLWEGMVEVGDAALRIGAVAGFRNASKATARRTYLAALLRAHENASLDGVLRTAAAFAALGDRDLVEQCLRIAESLSIQARNAHARDRVRAFKERPTALAGSHGH